MTDVLVQRIPLIATVSSVCFVLGCVFGTLCAVTIGRGRKRNRKHKSSSSVRRIEISYPLRSETEPTYSELTPPSSSTSSSSSSRSEQSRTSGSDSGAEPGRVFIPAGERDFVAERLSLRCSRSESRRRYNDYSELGLPGTPQRFSSAPNANSRSTSSNGGAPATCEMELSCRDMELLQSCSCSNALSPPELPPLPVRSSQQNHHLLQTVEDSPSCSTCIEVDLDELERVVLEQD